MAHAQDNEKMSNFEDIGYLFTIWKAHGGDVHQESLSMISSSSHDFGNDIDFFSIPCAKRVCDEEFDHTEVGKNSNFETYKSLGGCDKEILLLVCHGMRGRRLVMKNKESNEKEDGMCEKPGFEVYTKRISKSINFLDGAVKFLSWKFGLTFSKSSSFALGICP